MMRKNQYGQLANELQTQEGIIHRINSFISKIHSPQSQSKTNIHNLSSIISLAEGRLRSIRDSAANDNDKEKQSSEIFNLCKQIGITPLFDISGQPPLDSHIIRLSPDGKLLAVSDKRDGKVKLFSPSYLKEITTLHGAVNKLIDLEFSPEQTLLCAVTESADIIIWNLDNSEIIFHQSFNLDLTSRNKLIRVCWSGNGNRIGFIIKENSEPVYLLLFDVKSKKTLINKSIGKNIDSDLVLDYEGNNVAIFVPKKFPTKAIDIISLINGDIDSISIGEYPLEINRPFLSTDGKNIICLIGQDIFIIDWKGRIIRKDVDQLIDPSNLHHTYPKIKIDDNKVIVFLAKEYGYSKQYFLDNKGHLEKIEVFDKEMKRIHGNAPNRSKKWIIIKDFENRTNYLAYISILYEKDDHVDLGLFLLKDLPFQRYQDEVEQPFDIDNITFKLENNEGKYSIITLNNNNFNIENITKKNPDKIMPHHSDIDGMYVKHTIMNKSGLNDTINGRPWILKIFEVENHNDTKFIKKFKINTNNEIYNIEENKRDNDHFIKIYCGSEKRFFLMDKEGRITDYDHQENIYTGHFRINENGIYHVFGNNRELIDNDKAMIFEKGSVKIFLTKDKMLIEKGNKKYEFGYLKTNFILEEGFDVPNAFDISNDQKYLSFIDDRSHIILFDIENGKIIFRRPFHQPMGYYPYQKKANGSLLFLKMMEDNEITYREATRSISNQFSKYMIYIHEKNPSKSMERTFTNPISNLFYLIQNPNYSMTYFSLDERGREEIIPGNDYFHIESSRFAYIQSNDYFRSNIGVIQFHKDRNSEIGVNKTLKWTFSPLLSPDGKKVVLEWQSEDSNYEDEQTNNKSKEAIDKEHSDDNNDHPKTRSYYRVIGLDNGKRIFPILQSYHGSWSYPLSGHNAYGWLQNGDGIWSNHQYESGNYICRIWFFQDNNIKRIDYNGLLHRIENNRVITRDYNRLDKKKKSIERIFDINGKPLGTQEYIPYDFSHLPSELNWSKRKWRLMDRNFSGVKTPIYFSSLNKKKGTERKENVYPLPIHHEPGNTVAEYNFNVMVQTEGILELSLRLKTILDCDDDRKYLFGPEIYYEQDKVLFFNPIIEDDYSSHINPYNEFSIYHKGRSTASCNTNRVIGDHKNGKPFQIRNKELLILRREGSLVEANIIDLEKFEVVYKGELKNIRMDKNPIPLYFDINYIMVFIKEDNNIIITKRKDSSYQKTIQLDVEKIDLDEKPSLVQMDIIMDIIKKDNNGKEIKKACRVNISTGEVIEMNGILNRDIDTFNGLFLDQKYRSIFLPSKKKEKKIILPPKSPSWKIDQIPNGDWLWTDGIRLWVIDPSLYPITEVVNQD